VVAERYWLARALAVSQRFDTLIDLRSLLADPSPNVVTQTLYALGERKNRLVIQEIVRFMGESDHWYCQWYAYKALRKLGWKQGKSRG
jgi:HEAT repeat protein